MTDAPEIPAALRRRPRSGAALVWALTAAAFASAGLIAGLLFGWGTSLGAVWFRFAPESLGLAQAAVQRHLWPPLWDPGAQWILTKPVWAVFALSALVSAAAALAALRGREKG